MNKKYFFIFAPIALVLAVSVLLSSGIEGVPSWQDVFNVFGLSGQTDYDDSVPLRVSFIDVGQGDSIFISSGETDILIDAGERSAGETVVTFLKEQQVESLDYVVATHPHSDHIGGMPDVFAAFTVENVLMPELSESNTPTTSVYENFLMAVSASGANVIAAEPLNTYSEGELKMTVLAPGMQYDSLNNMSVALLLEYGEVSFLLTGDAESESESMMLQNCYSYLNADVFKAGHHGSSSSNSAEFVAAVSPSLAVISCGKDNSYGHPHRETLDTFNKFGIKTLRTDRDGTVTVSTDGTEIYY